jgi:hypothetical protein
MSQTSLFPESTEKRIQRIDGLILHLICGGSGGPLNLQIRDDEKAVLECLRFRRGLKNALTIREIQLRTKLDARVIKQAVRTLRLTFRLPIGSWKHADKGGYFLIVDDEDLAAWVKDVLDQVRAEIGVLRAAAGHQASLELLGQLQMEVQQENEASHG